MIRQEIISSPIGFLMVVSQDECLVEIELVNCFEKLTDENPSIFSVQLNEYFAGQRKHFDFAYLSPPTPFARDIMSALSQIPFGELISYGQLARAAGYSTGAARAVGSVMRTNPIPIVLPCHRVICADGTWGQYSLGGAECKHWLIEFESRNGQKY